MAAKKRATGKKLKRNPIGIEFYRPGNLKISDEAIHETDRDWRRWFIEIAQRRQDIDKHKNQTPIVSIKDDEGHQTRIARNTGEPKRAKFFLRKDDTGKASELAESFEKAAFYWKAIVGDEIASKTSVYSLKNGVLTIEVTSSTLFFEMKQIYYASCLRDLRDIWNIHPPLVDLKFRPGASAPS